MSDSWPPPDQRRSPDSGPYRQQAPQPGRNEQEDAYGSGSGGWGPPSAGQGQPGGQWGPPSGGGWGQQPPPGVGGPYGPPSYPPQYPAQYPAPYPAAAPQYGQSYAERYGYGNPYDRRPPIEPEEEPRSKATIAAVGILLVVFLLVAAGGAYALVHRPRPPASTTAQSMATATADTSTIRTVTDPIAHIQFGIPQGWTTVGSASTEGGLQCTRSNTGSVMQVATVPMPSGADFDSVLVAKGWMVGAAHYTTISDEQGPIDVTLAGATWAQEFGSFTRETIAFRASVLVTGRGGNIYVLAIVAPVGAFDSIYTRDFRALEQSFKFLP